MIKNTLFIITVKWYQDQIIVCLYVVQLNKKKTSPLTENKLPHRVFEDIKDLFSYYDQDNIGSINYTQFKAILNYITGGIVKRS